jgi:outer membrane receptor protein involved in Fe transport
LKFGADFNFDRVFNFFPGLFSGQYTFNSYALFAANTPSAFTQTLRVPALQVGPQTPDLNEYGLFIQDDWRVTPKLTLNLGLRYDLQDLADPSAAKSECGVGSVGTRHHDPVRDANNFGPRFGFSYAFDDKTVVRGGYGIFFGRTPAIMLGTAHSQNGIQVTGVSLNCTLVAEPVPGLSEHLQCAAELPVA